QVERVVLGYVLEFEGQRPMKARVYPSRVQMLQTHTTHTRLDAKEGGDVVGEVANLDGVGEEKLSRAYENAFFGHGIRSHSQRLALTVVHDASGRGLDQDLAS